MKQTLEEFIEQQPYYGHCNYEYREGIEVGANWQKEQQNEFAVEFALWCDNNAKKYHQYLHSIQDFKELLQIFKKEKGL